MAQAIQEKMALDSSVRVDRKSGIIRRARLLGQRSANGRTYSVQAMEQAAELYRTTVLNVEHRKEPDQRPILERVGFPIASSIVHDKESGAIFGDLQLFTESPNGRLLLEMAEKNPASLGLSHSAMADLNGTIVESVLAIDSIDFVGKPATNKNLFEDEGDAMKVSIGTYAASVVAGSPFKVRLTEAADKCDGLTVDANAKAEDVLSVIVEHLLKSSTPPATPPAPVAGDVSGQLTALSAKLDEALTWVNKAKVREMVLEALAESKIKPRDALVTELSVFTSKEMMLNRISTWPEHVRNGEAKMRIHSMPSNVTEGDDQYDGTFDGFSKRLGIPAAATA